jgi:tetraacyldisaccharide 4'-kinase
MTAPDSFRAIVSGQRKDPAAVCMRGLLRLAELPYGWAVAARNRRYDRGHATVRRVEVPVISVGNLTLGGTGKTPLVAWLARWFRDQQVRVVLISRGYRASGEEGNDEWRELTARLPDVPHVQDADRLAAARVAIEQLGAQLIVLDDAFQHRRIARDLDLVLIDATEPFGYEHVFPRGMLREPLSGLRRADVVVLSRCNLVATPRLDQLRARLAQLAPQAQHIQVAQRPSGLLSSHGVEIPLDQLPRGPLLGFCGIGNPSAFRQTLTDQGWQLADFRAFPDHHAYDPGTLGALAEWSAGHPQAVALVCTHKDLVKIGVDRLGNLPLWALRLELDLVSGREPLERRLRQLLARVPTT